MILLLLACNEFTVQPGAPVPPAEPPGLDPDADVGDPPDWADCAEGWYGQYYNLPADHPDVAPADDAPVPDDPEALDWWDPERVAFRRFDGTLDVGANWYPVDEGLAGDPDHFAVRWTAWMRAWSGTTLAFVLGSADDAWVMVDGQVVAALPGVHPFEPQSFTAALPAGQYPVDIRFAQRAGEASGFRFRVTGGDVSICYPDFAAD